MDKKKASLLGTVAALATVLGLVYTYTTCLSGKGRLENKTAELENTNRELAAELEGLRSDYRNLLVLLVRENRVGLNELEALPEEEVVQIEERVATGELSLPANIDLYFHPSGWMGDGKQGEDYVSLTRSPDHLKVIYTPGPEGWAGVYWQSPDGNWGEEPGRNLLGARRLTFWAKGETGTELVEFKTGGIRDHQYLDSFEKSLGWAELSPDWEQYEIDLSHQDLSSVIGAFAWTVSTDTNPDGATFYLKDIYFED